MIEDFPLISIITITRNRAAIIHRAIESIQAQTYPHYEHIVVDGASEDNTREVVNNYHDSRIRYIRLEAPSIINQLRAGFDHSEGQYITFLDDDDQYLPTKLEKQIALFKTLSPEYGLVYCWMDYFDDRTQRFLYTHKAELRGFVGDETVEKPKVAGTPTFLFRRDVFAAMGGWRDDIGILSDWELAARTCQRYKVDYVPESLVRVYVNHGHQRMSDAGFYKDYYEKSLLFAQHFLSEFANVFGRYPRKSVGHLYSASKACFMLGRWRKGFTYYQSLMRQQPTVKNLLLVPYCWIKRK